MSRRDLSNRNASSHASSELDYIIDSEKKASEPKIKKVTAEQAMSENRVFETSSSRDVTRVLFISQDTELLNPTKQSLDGYVDISDLFDEVHILILRQGIPPKNPALRVADNVWIYTAAANFWWQTPKSGLSMVKNQLEFATGFRPDLIVALDPFESALTAYKLGKKYNRPTQLHVLEDYTTDDFVKKDHNNYWRSYLPHFTVPKFLSVRTFTNDIATKLQKKFDIYDLSVLPRYYDYESMIDSKSHLDLEAKYKPFKFFLLFVGELSYESTLHQALDAARFALKNPHVGMIVLGSGPAKKEMNKRIKALKIEEQVIFKSDVPDILPYLKSANLMLVTDIDMDSEELVIKGAAAGIPMIMSQTERRSDIFTNGESAFLCNAGDVQMLTNRINDLLKDTALRDQFVINGHEIIRRQFHADPIIYQRDYRSSIEQAFFVDSEAELADEN